MSKYTALTDELHAYLVDHGARQDDVLARVQAETAERFPELTAMQIAPDQGAFLTLIATAIGARDALEIGTFTGYSAICIARGLAPGGRLVCCELSERYAGIAAANCEAAGIAERIEITVGEALDTLRALPRRELFDLIFIDADKPGYRGYFEEALARTRTGGLLILDNVLMDSRVLDPDPGDEGAVAMAQLNDELVGDERVDLAMVGIADGLTIARKR